MPLITSKFMDRVDAIYFFQIQDNNAVAIFPKINDDGKTEWWVSYYPPEEFEVD